MKRVPAYILVLTIMVPDGAYALDLGGIERKSSLNEPFNATIELQGAKAEELDTLSVKLADAERFKQAGLERTEVLSRLRFKVIAGEGGRDYIRITSQQPIQEQFLDFLIEVNWSKGRLFREFTVSLDAPFISNSVAENPTEDLLTLAGTSYDPNARLAEQGPNATHTAPSRLPSSESVTHRPRVSTRSEPIHHASPRVSPRLESETSMAGDSYGPTAQGDTLGKIAEKVKRASSVSAYRMMVALVRANPDAFFVPNNMNALKRGVILQIPDLETVSSISQKEALEEVKQQYMLWEEYRQSLAGRVAQRPVGAESSQGSTAVAVQQEPVMTEQDEAQLKLLGAADVIATDAATGASQDSADASVGGREVDGLRDALSLANESLESAKQENSELRSKLTEAEELIELLQRQVKIQNEEVAALQAKLAQQDSGAKEQPSTVEPVTPTAVAKPEVSGTLTEQPKIEEVASPTPLTEGQAPQEQEAKRTQSTEATASLESLFDGVPGGLTTVLAGLSVLLLAVVATVIGKRREESLVSEEEMGFEKPDEFEDMLHRQELSIGTAVGESTVVTARKRGEIGVSEGETTLALDEDVLAKREEFRPFR